MTLLMDIVTMKLPANALIFLTALRVEFNVNFLNRCRVNALSGEQVSKLVMCTSAPAVVELPRISTVGTENYQRLGCKVAPQLL